MINIAIGVQDNRIRKESQSQISKQRADELWQCVMYDRFRHYGQLNRGGSMPDLVCEIIGYDAGDER